MAIRFCGLLDDFSALERGECPADAVMMDEEDTMEEIATQALREFMPMLILVVALSIVRVKKGLDTTGDIGLGELLLGGIALAVLYVVFIFVHEGIHAILHPRGSVKEIWLYKAQAALVYCNAQMSRTRFIVMSLAPVVLLGFLPFIVWLFTAERVPAGVSIDWMLFCWLMIFGGMGDWYNVCNILRQVPKDAQVFNYGVHTYWLPKSR